APAQAVERLAPAGEPAGGDQSLARVLPVIVALEEAPRRMRIAAHQHELFHGVRTSLRDVLRHHRDVPGDVRAREGAEWAPRDQDLAPGGNQDSRQEAD